MEVSELKKVLHKKINELNDAELLKALNTIISKQDQVFKISKQWLEGIEEGRRDIREGRYNTLEDFQEKYKKWLKD